MASPSTLFSQIFSLQRCDILPVLPRVILLSEQKCSVAGDASPSQRILPSVWRGLSLSLFGNTPCLSHALFPWENTSLHPWTPLSLSLFTTHKIDTNALAPPPPPSRPRSERHTKAWYALANERRHLLPLPVELKRACCPALVLLNSLIDAIRELCPLPYYNNLHQLYLPNKMFVQFRTFHWGGRSISVNIRGQVFPSLVPRHE